MPKKKLVRDCQTRWSSTYVVIERLLNVRTSLTTVLQELEWDNLATSDWKHLENIHQVLKPFTLYTSLISREEYNTISSIIPVLMELTLHLEEVHLSLYINCRYVCPCIYIHAALSMHLNLINLMLHCR